MDATTQVPRWKRNQSAWEAQVEEADLRSPVGLMVEDLPHADHSLDPVVTLLEVDAGLDADLKQIRMVEDSDGAVAGG